MNTFDAIDMGEFEGVRFANDMDTQGEWVSNVKPGLSFYAVSIYNTSNGDERIVGRSVPARKNMSGEPCVDGWCGTTNNSDVNANGHWAIITANRLPNIGNGSVFTIEAERL